MDNKITEESRRIHMEKELLNTFDKELLLKDLCARLPYGVIVETPKGKGHVCNINITIFGSEIGVNVNSTIRDNFSINDVKPYLFPLSSMTEEEKEEYCQLQQRVIYNSKGVVNEDVKNYINYCYKKHLDINNLIPMKLAIDTTNLNVY